MNAIHIAYEGLLEKLRSIYGDGSTAPDSKSGPPTRQGRVLPQHLGDTPKRLTPEAFDAAFGRPGKTITIPSPLKGKR